MTPAEAVIMGWALLALLCLLLVRSAGRRAGRARFRGEDDAC